MFKYLTLLLMLFVSATLGIAQNTAGRIIGTVSAADGAIAGAIVVVTDTQTGRERTVTSSGSGTFEVPQLEFGVYTVIITAGGFKTFTATEVKVDANRETSLNAQLEIGQLSEQVTVVGGTAETINATNGELSNTISTQQVRELPLNGRSPLSLITLQAGANPTTNSINGQRSSSTSISRDGLNVQDNFIRAGRFVGDRPTVDDVSEVTVITQNAGVEQGGGSSIIQLITPRGGSKFHGNLFEFNRNSKFAANTQLNNSRGLPRPFLNRNQFGGSLSGPLPLPAFGEGTPLFHRDKGFFFFNYEGFRQAQQTPVGATTLLPQARNGTFTYTSTVTGQPVTVNVLTGTNLNLTGTNQTAFNNAGGVLSVDPIIQSRFLNNLPDAGNGVFTGTNFLQSLTLNRSNRVTREQYATRFDVDINDRNSVSAVYKRNTEANDLPGSSEAFSPTSTVNQGGPTDFFVVAYRIVPTSNFSNEIRAGLQNSKPFFANNNPLPGTFINQTLFTNPESTFEDQGRNTDYRNIQNNAVYSRGNHSFRFGGQLESYRFQSISNFQTTPTFTVATTGNVNTPGLTAALLPGISTADLAFANNLRYTLGGIIGGATQRANLISPEQGFSFGPAIDTYNYKIYSGYISDQWRARRDLTLNLGLRYEYYTPVTTPVAKYLEPVITNPDDILGSLSAPNAVLDIVGRNSGTPGQYTKPDRDNFAPSISIAYAPVFDRGFFGKLVSGTVFRGGFRVNYVNDEYVKATTTLVGANPGLGAAVSVGRNAAGQTTLRSSLTPRDGFEPLPTFSLPTFNPASIPITLAANAAAGGNLRTAFGVDPNYQVQRNYEYNFGIQHSLPFGNVLEVRYVGGFSSSASRTTDFNQIDIQQNGFLADFQRAQNNCRVQGQTLLTGPNDTRNPLLICTSAAFNANITGSQQLTVFPNLVNGGNLTNAANLNNIRNGTIALLARSYIQNAQTGSVRFTPATNTQGPLEILVNGGRYNYNALQAEIRRRTASGLTYQVNYTFQKTLTDVLGDTGADQNRQGTFLDNNRPQLNYGRADYDRTHTLNANMVYELPFGRGKRFLNGGGLMNYIFGGFQFSSIVTLSSGAPLSITDARSTFSIRNGRQGAFSSLSTDEIKELTGVFNTPNGFYFINPKVLFATATAPGQPTLSGIDLNQPLPAGYTLASVRATSGLNQAPFAGQVFFFNNAGQSGNLPINFINGTPYFNWDAGLSKSFRFTEKTRLQIRAEAFNVLNQTLPNQGLDLGIDSNSFGRITNFFSNRIIQFGARFDF